MPNDSYEPTELVQDLLNRLKDLEDYEQEDIVSTARAARDYINRTTIAYIRVKDQHKASVAEASSLRGQLEQLQNLIADAMNKK